VPSLFLTVSPNTEFRFAVGWRGAPDPGTLKQAADWLKLGLGKLGAGAKTNSGYGRFRPVAMAAEKESPMQEPLQFSTGKFQRKGSALAVIDAQNGTQYPIDLARFDRQSQNTLPGDRASVIYFYDEWNGSRRIWRVVKS
jgi:hypothetical protein